MRTAQARGADHLQLYNAVDADRQMVLPKHAGSHHHLDHHDPASHKAIAMEVAAIVASPSVFTIQRRWLTVNSGLTKRKNRQVRL